MTWWRMGDAACVRSPVLRGVDGPTRFLLRWPELRAPPGELLLEEAAMSLKDTAIIDQVSESCRMLGLLDITLRGRRSYGGARQASRYGLTWLPRCDGTPASNRWRRIKSKGHAEAVIQEASGNGAAPRRKLSAMAA